MPVFWGETPGHSPGGRSRFRGAIETLAALRKAGGLYRFYVGFELVVSAVLLISVSLIIVYCWRCWR
jgi:hypothetical protein